MNEDRTVTFHIKPYSTLLDVVVDSYVLIDDLVKNKKQSYVSITESFNESGISLKKTTLNRYLNIISRLKKSGLEINRDNARELLRIDFRKSRENCKNKATKSKKRS